MQNKHEVEGVFVPVAGEEENFLLGLSEGAGSVSATQLLVGSQVLRDADRAAFMDPTFWPEDVEAYRQKNGRQYPPAYRVKISVEWEQIPDDEAEALWRANEYQPAPEGEA